MPSVSELKMFAGLGVDCVGMSSIPESLVAHHSGMKVFVIMTLMQHLKELSSAGIGLLLGHQPMPSRPPSPFQCGPQPPGQIVILLPQQKKTPGQITLYYLILFLKSPDQITLCNLTISP